MSSSSGGGENFILYLQVELGLYDHFQTVAAPTALCQMNVVQLSYYNDAAAVTGDPTECPHAGIYQWTAYYTVPSFADSSLHYTPDVRLTFLNDQGTRFGCVVTGPIALLSQADAKAVAGLVALGISVTIFIGIFSILLYLSHRRKQRLEKLTRLTTQTAMQYQYFRTLPNGQVVPVTGHPPPVRPQQRQRPMPQQQQQHPHDHHEDGDDDDDDSEDALNISNPAYNETQLPSRPII
jgi:hypothetical protein